VNDFSSLVDIAFKCGSEKKECFFSALLSLCPAGILWRIFCKYFQREIKQVYLKEAFCGPF
jgi:hypothetical protein